MVAVAAWVAVGVAFAVGVVFAVGVAVAAGVAVVVGVAFVVAFVVVFVAAVAVVMADADQPSPIKLVLGKLKGVKRSDGGWVACCPAHPDKQQSLGVDLAGDRVLLKCFAGCDNARVVSAMGLRMSDLFPADTRPRLVESKPRSSLTLEELGRHKQLPLEHLRALGWRDGEWFGSPCVVIPYVRRDGSVHRERLRLALSAKDGTRWGQGSGQLAYEPDRGACAAQAGFLIVVEGETDVATCLAVGLPAIGMPGASAVKALEREHLAGVKAVFAVREPGEAGQAFPGLVAKRAAELDYAGPVYALPMPNSAKDPSALYQRDPVKFLELMHAAMLEASRPAPEPLADVWKTLGEWGSLTSAPPARRWLLERPDDAANGVRNVGVLPLGKVGMLVSAGGVGKTMTLVCLALAVATGRKWLEHYGVANPGRVLLALGEEDQEEIWRRVYHAAQAMRLTDAQIALAGSNIVAMPLAGRPVALVRSEGGVTTVTEVLEAMRKRLESGGQWRLIILDPLSRFAGCDTEKDNAAATRFVEVAESLVKAPGGPSVLIAHHTNKTSRTDGSSANAAHARGASGLSDGVRWVANLESTSDDCAKFEVTKSNYAQKGPPVHLVRDSEHGGFLRVQTKAEQQGFASRAAEAAAERVKADREMVLAAIAEHSGIRTFTQLHSITGGRKNSVHAAYHDLIAEGLLARTARGVVVADAKEEPGGVGEFDS